MIWGLGAGVRVDVVGEDDVALRRRERSLHQHPRIVEYRLLRMFGRLHARRLNCSTAKFIVPCPASAKGTESSEEIGRCSLGSSCTREVDGKVHDLSGPRPRSGLEEYRRSFRPFDAVALLFQYSGTRYDPAARTADRAVPVELRRFLAVFRGFRTPLIQRDRKWFRAHRKGRWDLSAMSIRGATDGALLLGWARRACWKR